MTIQFEDTEIVLSDLFDVKLTQYGRACFAAQNIPKDTEILLTKEPFGATVLYEFRKEVCSYCFHYEFGSYCKVKIPTIPNKKNYKGSGLWFCSDQCLEKWLAYDNEELEITNIFEDLLTHFQILSKKNIQEEQQDFNPVITQEFIDNYWTENIVNWEAKIKSTKKTKLLNQIPIINDDEYIAARFITTVLFNIYKKHESVNFFNHLQSNEILKIKKFPYLLKSQTLIYKFLKILLPTSLNDLLTIDLLRLIFGREYGNSFGIWQVLEDPNSTENKEYLGYMLFPEASFFNHSCRPNLRKSRIGNKMSFKTTVSIEKGDQLCIDYFNILNEPFNKRQEILSSNWFFNCACERCVEESKLPALTKPQA